MIVLKVFMGLVSALLFSIVVIQLGDAFAHVHGKPCTLTPFGKRILVGESE